MTKKALLSLKETTIIKNDKLEKSFEEEYKGFLKINFESINLRQKASFL